VTPNIESLFRAAPWWSSYDASPAPSRSPYYTLLLLRKPLLAGAGVERVPFQGSVMGRDLLVGGIACGGGVNLLAGTSHLESYLGPGQTSSSERVAQMREALTALARTGCANLVFAGDTNWDDATDGDLSKLLGALPGAAAPPWRDAWATLRPREAGHTYDSVANAMLVGSLKKRLDRVVFRLRDYEPAAIRMLGTAPLPGVTYEKTFRNGGSKTLPVCNSDHFGLLFTMRRVEKQGGVAA
jgi:tyrosyl-DNA phosphodiesterase 2